MSCSAPATTRSHTRLLPCFLALFAIVVGCRGPEPLRFAVTFEDAGSLERGARVMHRGLEVGEIAVVGIDDRGLVLVSVEVEDRFQSAVARNSVIRIERYGVRRRVQLTLEDGEGERVPLTDGDVLIGSEGIVDDLLSKIQSVTEQVFDRAAEEASELTRRLKDLPQSPEVRDLSEAMRELGEGAADRGRESWQRLHEEQLPQLRERAEAVRRRLEESGMAEEAEEFRRDFEQWLEESREPPPP